LQSQVKNFHHPPSIISSQYEKKAKQREITWLFVCRYRAPCS